MSLIFSLFARFMVFISKTETFLRATPLILQFRRYPGFQREAVRATLENCNFQGFTVLRSLTFLADLVAPLWKAYF